MRTLLTRFLSWCHNPPRRLPGSDAAAMQARSPQEEARMRLPWLIITMLIELGAGVVIARSGAVLQQVILLASFMPVISAISGNVGLQAAAISVRGLDSGQIEPGGWRQALVRELVATFYLALACGLLLGVVGTVWAGRWHFGVVVGVSMCCSMMTAGTMGTIIPIGSKRLGFDPATTAGPFETAFQDIIGFGMCLWLASLLLRWLH